MVVPLSERMRSKQNGFHYPNDSEEGDTGYLSGVFVLLGCAHIGWAEK